MNGKAAACAALVCCALGACGGGGGGGSGALPLSASFAPASLSASFNQGDSPEVDVSVNIQGQVSVTVTAVIRDAQGAMQHLVLTQTGPSTYSAAIFPSVYLPVGTNSGNFELDLCADASCQTLYGKAGLPYAFTVTSVSNLTPLTALAGAGDWVTTQGNARRNGYVPGTLDPSKFTLRWLSLLPNFLFQQPDTANPLSSLVTAGGLVYVADAGVNSRTTTHSAVYALRESDGSKVWNHDFGATLPLSPLAEDANQLFLFAGGASGVNPPGLVSLNAQSGAVNYQSGQGSAAFVTATGGQVFGEGSVSSSFVDAFVNVYDQAAGAAQWSGSVGGGALPVDANSLYSVTKSGSGNYSLNRIKRTDGSTTQSVDLGGGFSGPRYVVLVPNSPRVIVAGVNGEVLDVDTSTSSVKWQQASLPNGPMTYPMVANGTVYFALGQALIALSESTGALQWSTSLGDYPDFNAITTDNLLFVSLDSKVVAVDLASHSIVWTYPHGGQLAISANGVLYISRVFDYSGALGTADGYLAAINLH